MNECGSPDRREFGMVEEKSYKKKRRKTKKVVAVPGKQQQEYPSSGDETWHYDCGPDGFIHVLKFSNSRLTSITTGGRGTRRGMPCPMGSEWTTRKETAR